MRVALTAVVILRFPAATFRLLLAYLIRSTPSQTPVSPKAAPAVSLAARSNEAKPLPETCGAAGVPSSM